jgi:hypothetical protein
VHEASGEDAPGMEGKAPGEPDILLKALAPSVRGLGTGRVAN